jgi:hypothetical protein
MSRTKAETRNQDRDRAATGPSQRAPCTDRRTSKWKTNSDVKILGSGVILHMPQKSEMESTVKTSLGHNENQRQNHYEHESLTAKEIITGEPMWVHGPRPNGELKIYW